MFSCILHKHGEKINCTQASTLEQRNYFKKALLPVHTILRFLEKLFRRAFAAEYFFWSS